jgi:COP9 signalosome complex subunit 3
VAAGAEQTQNYIPAIQLLHHVIFRLDSTSSTLTSTHRTFVRLCLLGRAYGEAVDVLDKPIYHIPASHQEQTYKYLCSPSDHTSTYITTTTGFTRTITTRTFLEYYLLGAMCYMSLRRFRDAQVFLEIVLTAPCAQNVSSAIVVEAYKKWSLIGLVVSGTSLTLPKGVSQSGIKHVKAVSKPYDCVVDAFKTNSIEKLQGEIEAGNAIWQEDNNYGLMVEVYQAFRKFSILSLGKTFAALSIVEIARRTSPDPANVDETRAYVSSLIALGELSAVITDSEPARHQVLRFLPPTASQKTETEVESSLAAQTQALHVLLKHVRDTEHQMEVSKEYVDYLKRLKKGKEEEKKNGGTKATVDDIDEDMMDDGGF